jgi:hypothetical protein
MSLRIPIIQFPFIPCPCSHHRLDPFNPPFEPWSEDKTVLFSTVPSERKRPKEKEVTKRRRNKAVLEEKICAHRSAGNFFHIQPVIKKSPLVNVSRREAHIGTSDGCGWG